MHFVCLWSLDGENSDVISVRNVGWHTKHYMQSQHRRQEHHFHHCENVRSHMNYENLCYCLPSSTRELKSINAKHDSCLSHDTSQVKMMNHYKTDRVSETLGLRKNINTVSFPYTTFYLPTTAKVMLSRPSACVYIQQNLLLPQIVTNVVFNLKSISQP